MVNNTDARRALRRGGEILVQEFREAILAGTAVDHARSLVPDALEGAVTEQAALDLFGAAATLLAHLDARRPPARGAEELLATELVTYADSWLGEEVEVGVLNEAQARAARHALLNCAA